MESKQRLKARTEGIHNRLITILQDRPELYQTCPHSSHHLTGVEAGRARHGTRQRHHTGPAATWRRRLSDVRVARAVPEQRRIQHSSTINKRSWFIRE